MNNTCEVSWFSALCDDDYEQMGVIDPALQSSWEHCRDIVLTAQQCGFDNILLPSGYALGIDTVAFAAAIAPMVDNMRLLVAVRCGEVWTPQLARQLATINQILKGRLTINIISSEMPGETLDGISRYTRTLETMTTLRSLLLGNSIEVDGHFINVAVDAPRITQENPTTPPFYFGGLSEEAREVAAQAADVYLMWPDVESEVIAIMDDLRKRASRHGRTLRFGYRAHVIVRDTEAEAREAATQLMAALDDEVGNSIRERSLDSHSVGVRRQAELRDSSSDDGFVEEFLWTGIGRARSGCGAAIVGSAEQVLNKINRYRELGIDAFILSGYPHQTEAEHFARLVLGHLPHGLLQLS
jgi:alkanesulfonate monooxygenase